MSFHASWQAPRVSVRMVAPVRGVRLITRATVVRRSRHYVVAFPSGRGLLPLEGHLARAAMSRGQSSQHAQDKEKVLADVRSIISQQLGTDLDKVGGKACLWGGDGADEGRPDTSRLGPSAPQTTSSCLPPQVAADSKFVDLGADSLDTVSTLWQRLAFGRVRVGRAGHVLTRRHPLT